MKEYTDVIDHIVDKEFLIMGEAARKTFNFENYTEQVTEKYQSDTDFVELMKQLNQEIKDLKELMKNALMKDYKIFTYPENEA